MLPRDTRSMQIFIYEYGCAEGGADLPASFRTVSTMNAGSFRFPRWGTGAR